MRFTGRGLGSFLFYGKFSKGIFLFGYNFIKIIIDFDMPVGVHYLSRIE